MLPCGLPCLDTAEFYCRDGGPVCLKHSHPRSCCAILWLDHEDDAYGDALGLFCTFEIDNPEAVGDPNQTPRVRLVMRRAETT